MQFLGFRAWSFAAVTPAVSFFRDFRIFSEEFSE